MKSDHLVRFAADLRVHAHVDATVDLNPDPADLHVLKIKGVDFYFRADGSGYDGWGMATAGSGFEWKRRPDSSSGTPG